MPEIPGIIWRRPDMLAALQARDIAQTFRLLRQYAGLSQTAMGGMTGMSQGKVSVMSGNQRVTALEVFERIADGLGLPDRARVALAPRASRGSRHPGPGWHLGERFGHRLSRT
jgi:hypothetical protein